LPSYPPGEIVGSVGSSAITPEIFLWVSMELSHAAWTNKFDMKTVQ